MLTLSSSVWSRQSNACRTTPALGASFLNSAMSRSAKSYMATTASSTAFDTTLSRSRQFFTGLVRFDLTDIRDIRASNFRLQPTAARVARCGG
jgi:hypothetical protein